VGWGLRMDANAGRAVHIETASRHVMEHWNKIMKRFSTACQGGGALTKSNHCLANGPTCCALEMRDLRSEQGPFVQVAKQLLAEEFDLAFQVIHTFGLSASQAYTAAAKDLAAAGQLPGILALLENVRGTSRDQDIDQVAWPKHI